MRYYIFLFLLALGAFANPAEPFLLGVQLREIAANQEIPPKPLETTGLDPDLRGVLDLYYLNSLGGEAHWDTMKTLLTKGQILFPDGRTLDFKNYRKKPDLNRTILYLPKDFEMIQSFDGTEAWEWLTFASDDPHQMPLEKSVDFIRDACFGSHLIYPLIPGKKLEYLGNRIVEGKQKIRIQVTLPNSQLLEIVLNASGYQISEETNQFINGKKRRVVQSDFRKISGVAVPFKSQTFVDDKLVQEVRIDSALFNQGVYSWMFKK